jgi:hypothetical protein
MQIDFKKDTHEYFISGIKVPNPTGILEKVGITDFSGIPPERLKIAQDFGTAVHMACELWDKKNLNESVLDPKLIPYLNAWKKFLDQTKFEIRKIEQIVGSEKYMFAGTLDRFGFFFGKQTIIEIKTCYEMNIKAARLQTAAYFIANNEMYKNEKATQRMVVLLKPTGDYDKEMLKNSMDTNIFLSCLSVINFREAK